MSGSVENLATPATPLNLKVGDKGQVLNAFPNYCEVVENDPEIKGRIWWNSLDGRIMMAGFPWDMNEHPLRDLDVTKIRLYISDQYGISSADNIRQAIESVAFDHKRHPILEELDSLPAWDGERRLGELFPRYLGAERSDYTEAATKLFFNGAIQRVRHPGIKFDSCVVLADTMQGTGKSALCRMMALRDEWSTDSMGDLSDSKTAFESLRGRWIIELGEMIATRRTRDIEAIKAFLSRQADDYRQPYTVYAERYPRQCVFVGTTNKPQFLPDDKTGNRRFIPILCDGNKADVHPLEDEQATRAFIRQCYAEALVAGDAEEWPLTLDKRFSEQLRELQAQSAPDDPRVGMIQQFLNEHTELDRVCSKMIFDRVFDREPLQHEIQQIGEIMTTQIEGWRPDGRKWFTAYGGQKAWKRHVPPVDFHVPPAQEHVPQDEFIELSDDDDVPFLP